MRAFRSLALIAIMGLLARCGPAPSPPAKAPAIKVRGAEQEKLHRLSSFDLAIALKRAIYDAGYTCQRLTDGGFVGTYKNLDIWMAKCSEGRQWAVFAGPDGTAQVRDCKDVEATGLPKCIVAKRPEGSFTEKTPGKAVRHATFNG